MQSDDRAASGRFAEPSADALMQGARVARAFALEHCRHAIGGDCTWYHGVWQYLRALGVLKKTPGGHKGFLIETLSTLASAGSMHRVLISGSADDAMSLVAIEGYRCAGAPLDLTVIDRCESPLALSRWSAARVGHELKTQQADILEFAADSPYDVILANSFLPYFSEDVRPRLFAKWATLLRRGGKLVLTNRLSSTTAPPGGGGFTSEQAEVFCALVRKEADRNRQALGLDPAEVESWAREYTRRLVSYPLRSVGDLAALLRSAGFVPDRLDTVEFPGTDNHKDLSGPTSAGRAEYVRLVATRR